MKSNFGFGAISSFAILLFAFGAQAAVPSEMASLKPFKVFQKGEGEGVAKRYVDRSKADIIALLRDRDRWNREMRISCDVWVKQIAEAHPNIPFEGCEGAAAAIAGGDFQVVACVDSMTKSQNRLSVTSRDGTMHGAWHRQCLPGEQVLTWKEQPVASLKCMNVVIPVAVYSPPVTSAAPAVAPPVPAPKPTAPQACKIRDIYRVNVWQATAMQLPGVADSVAFEATNQDYFSPGSLSRSKGAILRKQGTHSVTPHSVTVNLIKASGEVRQLWAGQVVGKVEIRIPDDFVAGDVIQEVYADTSKLHSPRKDKRAEWKELIFCINNSHTVEVVPRQ